MQMFILMSFALMTIFLKWATTTKWFYMVS